VADGFADGQSAFAALDRELFTAQPLLCVFTADDRRN